MVYIRRDVEDGAFLEWFDYVMKTKIVKPALFVHGARQVGKTTTVLHFAKEHFENVYYFNLMESKNINVSLAERSYSNHKKSLEELLSAWLDVRFIDSENTVIIFDEVQSAPEVYGQLRLFTRGLKSQIIISGSYLGMIVHHAGFVPMGDLFGVYMTGFTFKEFLRTVGKESYIDMIKNKLSNLEPFSHDVHSELLYLFNEYMNVGGYPAIVSNYLEGFSTNLLSLMFNEIVNRFCNESLEYLENIDEKAALNDVLYHIPRFLLTRESVATKVSKVTELINKLDKNHNKIDTKTVKNVITWLRDAHMFTQSGRCASFEFDDMVGEGRIYVRDVGLAKAILGNTDTAKGIITEGFICTTLEDMLSQNFGDNPKTIAYIEEPDLEIDFFVHTIYGKTAIEVKSGSNMKNRSSIKLLNDKKIDFIIRTGESNLGKEGNILTVPLYAFPFLDLKKT